MTKPIFAAATFPSLRMRRNRRTAWSRGMVRETTLGASDLIWPLFVVAGENRSEDVPSMPGVRRHSIDLVVKKV